MSVDRILPYYVGFCIVSLFTGVAYETEVLVIRPFDIMIGAAMVVAVRVVGTKGYLYRLEKGLPYYLFVALYLYRGLNGLIMTGTALAVKELVQGVEFLILIHLVAQATMEKNGRMRFLWTLYVGFGVIAVGTALLHIAEGQYSGYKYLADLGYTSGGAAKYAFGLFGLMALVFWVGKRDGWYTFPIFALAILLALLSGERKGWVSLAAASVSIYYVSSNFHVRRVLSNLFSVRSVAVVLVVIVAASVAYNYGYSRESLESIGDTYNLVAEAGFNYVPTLPGQRQDVGRYNGLVFTVDALARYPVFGVGTERGKEAVNEIPNPGVNITTGHGEYQRYALENGLIGLFIYVAAWVAIWVRSIKRSRCQIKHEYIVSVFMIGLVAYSTVVNMFMGGGAHNIALLSLPIGIISCKIN